MCISLSKKQFIYYIFFMMIFIFAFVLLALLCAFSYVYNVKYRKLFWISFVVIILFMANVITVTERTYRPMRKSIVYVRKKLLSRRRDQTNDVIEGNRVPANQPVEEFHRISQKPPEQHRPERSSTGPKSASNGNYQIQYRMNDGSGTTAPRTPIGQPGNEVNQISQELPMQPVFGRSTRRERSSIHKCTRTPTRSSYRFIRQAFPTTQQDQNDNGIEMTEQNAPAIRSVGEAAGKQKPGTLSIEQPKSASNNTNYQIQHRMNDRTTTTALYIPTSQSGKEVDRITQVSLEHQTSKRSTRSAQIFAARQQGERMDGTEMIGSSKRSSSRSRKQRPVTFTNNFHSSSAIPRQKNSGVKRIIHEQTRPFRYQQPSGSPSSTTSSSEKELKRHRNWSRENSRGQFQPQPILDSSKEENLRKEIGVLTSGKESHRRFGPKSILKSSKTRTALENTHENRESLDTRRRREIVASTDRAQRESLRYSHPQPTSVSSSKNLLGERSREETEAFDDQLYEEVLPCPQPQRARDFATTNASGSNNLSEEQMAANIKALYEELLQYAVPKEIKIPLEEQSRRECEAFNYQTYDESLPQCQQTSDSDSTNVHYSSMEELKNEYRTSAYETPDRKSRRHSRV